MKTVRVAVAILAFAAASLALSVAEPGIAMAHDSTSNGCTTPIPVNYWNDRFDRACDNHDHCYNRKWYGNSAAGKLACDWNFYNEMLANCGWNVVCRGVAYTYYTAVYYFGWYAWYNSSWFH